MLFPRCSTDRWLKVPMTLGNYCCWSTVHRYQQDGWKKQRMKMHQNTTSLSYILVFDVGTQLSLVVALWSHITLFMVLFIILFCYTAEARLLTKAIYKLFRLSEHLMYRQVILMNDLLLLKWWTLFSFLKPTKPMKPHNIFMKF